MTDLSETLCLDIAGVVVAERHVHNAILRMKMGAKICGQNGANDFASCSGGTIAISKLLIFNTCVMNLCLFSDPAPPLSDDPRNETGSFVRVQNAELQVQEGNNLRRQRDPYANNHVVVLHLGRI